MAPAANDAHDRLRVERQAPLRHHLPPAGTGRPEIQEGESGLGEDRGADRDREDHDDRRRNVRKQVPRDDSQVTGANHPRSFHVDLVTGCERCRPHHARSPERSQDRQGEDDSEQGHLPDLDEEEQEDEARDGDHRVDQSLQDEVDEAAEVAGGNADDRSDHRRQGCRGEAEVERPPCPHEQPREQVATLVVGPEGVRPGRVREPQERRRADLLRVRAAAIVVRVHDAERLVLVVRRHVRAQHAQHQEDDGHAEADRADLLLSHEPSEARHGLPDPGPLLLVAGHLQVVLLESHARCHSAAPTVTRGSIRK